MGEIHPVAWPWSTRNSDTPAPTGVFFGEQTAEAIRRAVDAFEANHGRILSTSCRANAERFGAPRFRAEMAAIIEREWEKFARQ